MDFSGKTIAIGVCGGVAAYRVCDLIRECQRRGAARVIPLMTHAAGNFIPATTLEALSHEKVYTSELAMDASGIPAHIALAQEADILVIMPATVNTIAKLSAGMADDLVSTTFMTFTGKPVVIVPAMNTRMWRHPLFQQNLDTLRRLDNVTIVSPTAGLLACGETGEGHLADQESILQAVYRQIHPEAGRYTGVRVIVTAGGTREPIDAVRVVTNRSSGKMGLALADQLFAMGADVTLVTTADHTNRPYKVVPVETAWEMQVALESRFDECDLLVMAAAVSDFRAENPDPGKIKRHEHKHLTLEMVPNTDILATLGERKKPGQVLVGFAAESRNLLEHARAKLLRKNIDAIVANDISRKDIGFDSTDNEVSLLFSDGVAIQLPKDSKPKVARQVLNELYRRFYHAAADRRRGRPDKEEPAPSRVSPAESPRVGYTAESLAQPFERWVFRS